MVISRGVKVMYVKRNELIARLVTLTGKSRSEFIDKTVKELSEMYDIYITK